jgi:hypothetical protein
MQYIQLFFRDIDKSPPFKGTRIWSRADYIWMIRTVQENGAQNLWWLDIQINLKGRHEGCLAKRLGWQNVPWQRELRGDWKVDLLGALPDTTNDCIIS